MLNRMKSAVTSEELDEWLRSVEVIGEDERRDSAPPPPQKKKEGSKAVGRSRCCSSGRRGGKQPRWRRRSSLDCPASDAAAFGIDAETLLLASNANDGQSVGRTMSEADAISDLEASPVPSTANGLKFGYRDELFAQRVVSSDSSAASCCTNRSSASSTSAETVCRRNSSKDAAGEDPPAQFQFSRNASLPGLGSPGLLTLAVQEIVHSVRTHVDQQDSDIMPGPDHCPRGQSRFQVQPRFESRFFRAMEKSQSTQGHNIHSRRSMRLMKRTELTRSMLFDVLSEAASAGSPAPAASDAVGHRRASAPDDKRPHFPSHARNLRGKSLGAEDIAQMKEIADLGGRSRGLIGNRRLFVGPGPQKKEEDLVRAELRRLARDQMMVDLRRSIC